MRIVGAHPACDTCRAIIWIVFAALSVVMEELPVFAYGLADCNYIRDVVRQYWGNGSVLDEMITEYPSIMDVCILPMP